MRSLIGAWRRWRIKRQIIVNRDKGFEPFRLLELRRQWVAAGGTDKRWESLLDQPPEG